MYDAPESSRSVGIGPEYRDYDNSAVETKPGVKTVRHSCGGKFK
jgi:hypothetical protein